MAYDPGALNASLAAAVGDDGDLMTELKAAFAESAARQLDLLGRSRCDANWAIAAARLKASSAMKPETVSLVRSQIFANIRHPSAACFHVTAVEPS